MGNVATWLAIQHHSAVELVDRLWKRGLVPASATLRTNDEVLVQLTARG